MADKTKPKKKNPIARAIDGMKEGQQRGAQEEILQHLFDDMYRERKKIYKMNFVRGIFLGFGTVIGGTVVVAIMIWIMSFFINAPVIGDFVREVQESIDQTSSSN